MKFFNALKANAEIARLTSRITELEAAAGVVTGERETAMKALNDKIEAQTGQIATLTTERDTAKADADKLKAEATALDAAAEEKARQILANLGINQPLKQDAKEKAGASKAALWDQYNALTDERAKTDFWQEHRAEML